MARTTKVFGVLGSAAAALLTTTSVHAQTRSAPIVLDPVNVTSAKQKQAKSKSAPQKRLPRRSVTPGAGPVVAAPPLSQPLASPSGVAPVQGYVAKATTAGSKTDTPIEEIPQSVSVVGRSEIEDRNAGKVDEALRYTSGVFAQPFGTDTDTNWLFIRGFQATQTGVYQDGLQLYGYAFGAFYVDPFGLERIEVLKGAASVLYGGSNPGGIVNNVSKRPTGERLRYLEAGVNDAGNAHLAFDISDRAGPAVAYRINGRIAGGETYSDFQDGFRGVISPTLKWSDGRTSLTVLANYTHVDEKHGGGSFLPYVGTVVPASFGRIPRDANYTEPSLDRYEREQASIGYEFEHKITPDLVVRQNARFGVADVSEVNLYPNGYQTTDSLARINFGHDTSVSTFLLDNQVTWRVHAHGAEHTVLAGVDYKYFNIDQVQGSALFGTTTPIRVLNPIYGVPQTPRVSYLNQDLTQKQIGTYIQDQIRFGGGWLLTLNGRYDWVSTESQDGPTYYAPAQNAQNDSHDAQASGRAGLAYSFRNGLTPYASVATFFNPVIGTTTGGDFFKPETGQQYEFGVKYVPTFVDAVITAAWFDLTRQNVLTADPTNIFAQVQTGEVTSRGFEIEAKANLTKALRLTAAFTAYDLTITKDTDASIVGRRPYVVPEVMASFSLDYTFRHTHTVLDGVTVGGGVRYLGSSFADQQNTLEVPEVTLFDAKIGYSIDNWGIDLNVSNLFDEPYVASCQGALVCSYGEGRVVKVKTHVKW